MLQRIHVAFVRELGKDPALASDAVLAAMDTAVRKTVAARVLAAVTHEVSQQMEDDGETPPAVLGRAVQEVVFPPICTAKVDAARAAAELATTETVMSAAAAAPAADEA